MELIQSTAEIFIPDGIPIEQALARATRLSVGAHQDGLGAVKILKSAQHSMKNDLTMEVIQC